MFIFCLNKAILKKSPIMLVNVFFCVTDSKCIKFAHKIITEYWLKSKSVTFNIFIQILLKVIVYYKNDLDCLYFRGKNRQENFEAVFGQVGGKGPFGTQKNWSWIRRVSRNGICFAFYLQSKKLLKLSVKLSLRNIDSIETNKNLSWSSTWFLNVSKYHQTRFFNNSKRYF